MLAKPSAPKETPGPGGCTPEGCSQQQQDPFLGHPLPRRPPSSYGQKQQPPHKKSDHIITNLTFQREARIKPKAEKIKRG